MVPSSLGHSEEKVVPALAGGSCNNMGSSPDLRGGSPRPTCGQPGSPHDSPARSAAQTSCDGASIAVAERMHRQLMQHQRNMSHRRRRHHRRHCHHHHRRHQWTKTTTLGATCHPDQRRSKNRRVGYMSKLLSRASRPRASRRPRSRQRCAPTPLRSAPPPQRLPHSVGVGETLDRITCT